MSANCGCSPPWHYFIHMNPILGAPLHYQSPKGVRGVPVAWLRRRTVPMGRGHVLVRLHSQASTHWHMPLFVAQRCRPGADRGPALFSTGQS